MKTIWPFRHFGLKVLSLGIAVLLWFAVAGEETVERGLRIPLELQQFPSGLELQAEPPALVDVRVRGASSALSRTAVGDVVAVLDLHSARPGRRLFQLTPEQVRVPFGVQVVQITPATIALVFEHSATRQVPVSPSIDGNPAAGFIVGKTTADPQTVDVVGPESAVERATEALTEPVSVAGARSRVVEHATVGFLNPSLRLASPRSATISVEIVPGPPERALRGQGVRLRGLVEGLTAEATPAAVEVILRGSRQVLNHIDAGTVVPFVDLAGLGPGEYSLSVRVEAPHDAEVARVEPSVTRVRIARGKN